MQECGQNWEEVKSSLLQARSKDLPYERVLSSMCTYPHPVAIEAHNMFIESNMGDYGLFMGTYELEKQVLGMLGDLLHNSCPYGYLTTGGTESNIQAVRAMINSSQSIKKPNIIVPSSAHFSFDKISNILKIDVRKARILPNLAVDTGHVSSLIDKSTIGLVGIAGSTEFGQVDPISELSKIALDNNIFLHVDAAFGGFVLPFLNEHIPFDFSLPGVTSVAIDPHKMGMSTIPSGALLFREKKMLDSLKVETPYLTINSQFTLTGTRSGASVAATYAVMKHLGKEGYRKIVDRCISLTQLLIKETKSIGLSPVIDPVMNIIALYVPDPRKIREELALNYGWQVSITKEPSSIRLVIMPHMTEETILSFVRDLNIVINQSASSTRLENDKIFVNRTSK
ncbi:MAG: tyrosine decarboxylase MfnA [Deferribacterales bacterium]|jgi:tyrosine decarboxylase/aspartate 1-decarboxylase|nr:tyrosine decarboxylase MfnA [Deferribacterales bacterium]